MLTATALNAMSLMGVVMLDGISMSNSILSVEFAHRLKMEGRGVSEAFWAVHSKSRDMRYD